MHGPHEGESRGTQTESSSTHRSIDKGATLFALTISVVGVAATLVADWLIGQTHFFASADRLLALCAGGLLLALALYVLADRLYCAIDSHRYVPSQECFSLKALDRKFFLGAWAIILLCWLPWFITHFPGNIDIDILFQMAQYYGITNLTNHHPVITTFIFGAFWRVGDLLGSHAWSCMLWTLISTAMTAASFSLFVSYLKQIGAKRWIITSSMAFFALFPPIPVFATTMVKDTLFGWCWIPFLLCCIEVVRTRGLCLKNRAFLMSLFFTSLFLVFVKQTGVYYVSLALLALCCLRFGPPARLGAVLAGVLCANALWIGFATIGLGVTVSAGDYSRESASVPSQQVALLLSTRADELLESDWEVLESAFSNPREMADTYDPQLADAAKSHWRGKQSFATRGRFLIWWAGAWVRWPDVFTAAFIANAYSALWVDFPLSQGAWKSLLYRDWLAPDEVDYAISRVKSNIGNKYSEAPSDMQRIDELARGLRRPEGAQAIADAMRNLAVRLGDITLFERYCRVLFAFWLPLFALGYAIHGRNKSLLAVLVPILLSTATLLVGPAVLQRYLITQVYAAPVLLASMVIVGPADDLAHGYSTLPQRQIP